MNAKAASAHDDWNRHWRSYADSNALNPAQAYRRRLILLALDLARAASARVRLLDVGCGQGEFSAELAERYPNLQLLGVDLSAVSVSIAQGRVPSGAFYRQDLLQRNALPEQYQGWATHAVCSEVLEHLDDPSTALRNIRSYLAPGARLVVTVPAGPISAFDEHLGHRRHFTPVRLRQLLLDAGLEVESLNGAGFPFFNLYRLMVIARGEKLIADLKKRKQSRLVKARLTLMDRIARVLFRLNFSDSRFGWQVAAVARKIRKEGSGSSSS